MPLGWLVIIILCLSLFLNMFRSVNYHTKYKIMSKINLFILNLMLVCLIWVVAASIHVQLHGLNENGRHLGLSGWKKADHQSLK